MILSVRNLFDKMVVPIILYNSEIWGTYLLRNKQILCENNEFLFDLKNISEDLHIKFMKVFKNMQFGCQI